MAKHLYMIKLLESDLYKLSDKKTHKYALIANNFCDEGRLNALPIAVQRLYLGIVLIASEQGKDTVTINERQGNDLLTTRLGLDNALSSLQSIQLLTFEKSLVLHSFNKNELNELNEKKRIYVNQDRPESLSPPQETPTPVDRIQEPETHELVELWNSLVKDLPKVVKIGKARFRQIDKALTVFSMESWKTIFQKAEASDFLTGRDGKWQNCGFDWVINQTNAIKVFEGNYDNKEKAKPVDWTVEANKVLQSCQKHGFSSEKVMPHIGEGLVSLVKQAGGFYSLGQMPNNEHTIRVLAGKLKAAHELSKQKPPGGS